MSIIRRRTTAFTLGALLTAASAGPVFGDDIEIYKNHAEDLGARPNVLLIMDSSASMVINTIPGTKPLYDPAEDYGSGSGCAKKGAGYYFSTDNNPPKSCDSKYYVSAANFVCAAAKEGLDTAGMWPFAGRAPAVQYRNGGWTTLNGNDGKVECKADEGVHGDSTDSTKKPYLDGRKNQSAWSATNQNRWDALSPGNYRFYTSNYMNYLYGPNKETDLTRLEVAKGVAKALASSVTGVNLGLMRYNGDTGGFIVEPVGNIADNRSTLVKAIDDLDAPDYTPLSETLYEAALYFQGKKPAYGAARSKPSSMSGGNYISPIQYSCQKNYIVYLTDGAPTRDHNSNADIQSMINATKEPDISCKSTVEPFHDSFWTEGSGLCLNELTGWLAGQGDPEPDGEQDPNPKGTDLSTTVLGKQTVNTYIIGFGEGVTASKNYLDEAAAAGGTVSAYSAKDGGALTDALQQIFTSIQQTSGSFVTPSVSVNAFNRAQTSDDLYFSLFKVGNSLHWSGNLKKYKLQRSTTDPNATAKIVDAGGKDAVDSDGFFAPGTTSLWSGSPDGANITIGGAVSQLPDPDSRKVYTTLSGTTLVELKDSNVNDKAMATGDSTTSCGTECKAAVAWARGYRLDADDPDKILTDTQQFIGDPLHGRPLVVTYSSSKTLIFVPTNDGFLHAFDSETGKEEWSWIPPELLGRLKDLRKPTGANHTYGLDGDIRVLRLDVDQDGEIESGDRVWIFFGMRGGGDHYYAMDVTTPGSPKLMWNIGPAELPNVGQTWSTPVVTRVRVGTNGNTDPEKFVLIFGGGYDLNQESQSYSQDEKGNRIYMVEAQTGKLLWSAGGPSNAAAPNLLFEDTSGDGSGNAMDNSIPGRITVIDTNGDLFADRMYAADMGGRIWRFDIFNGKEASNGLVTGGVFAKLGAGGVPGADKVADNRRFYNAPDVSLINIRGTAPFFNIAIGSGYRGHPLNKQTVERFYSLRDMNPYAQLSQADYNNWKPILDTDGDDSDQKGLVDVTADPAGTAVTSEASGWKLTLTRAGEKVMSESTTVNNVLLFTTFQPTSTTGAGACYPTAVNRVYALTAFGGKPAINFKEGTAGDEELTNEDISTELKQKDTIVGDVAVAVQRDEQSSIAPPTICLAGMEVLKKCVDIGGTIRTFWNRGDAK